MFKRFISKTRFLLVLCIILVLSLCACNKSEEKTNENIENKSTQVDENQQTSENNQDANDKANIKIDESKIAFTVGDAIVTKAEVMLYMQPDIEKTEALYGKEIWDLELDKTGTTVGKSFKEEILRQISYVKIVCQQAKNLGISLSDDELLDITLFTEDYLAKLTKEQIDKYEITYDLVYGIYCDNMLANKVYEVLTLNIDTAVTEEEVRNMDLEYITITKFYRDANGLQLEYKEEELATIKQEAQDFLEDIRTKDITSLTLIEQDKYQVTEIIGNKDYITNELNSELGGLAFGLKQGELSDVYETEYGFYILFCASEVDEEATKQATIKLLEERQRVLFEDSFNEWEANTKIKINFDVWDTI